MRPPFTLTPRILNLVAEVSQLLGRYEGLHAPAPQPKLRRQNRIRTIQGSLAIEGNTLDLDQVTAVFDKKRVLGPRKDILEVQNTILLYELLPKLNPESEKDLLKAHGILMKDLAGDAGKLRQGAVGILKGTQVSHVAPPAKQVARLVGELLRFLNTDQELSPLIKACVFHYELEFIHPFSDGNGRMGRAWQSAILMRFHPAFEFTPVESLIKERQSAYYRALEQSDKKGESTLFIEFSLEAIRDSLQDFLKHLKPAAQTPESRIELARGEFQDREFTRKDYIAFFKTISTATASRDLTAGVGQRKLKKTGTKAVARYRFF